MKVISIDWDYFVEESPMLDWGHREQEIFLDAMWQVRRMQGTDLTKAAPFRGRWQDLYLWLVPILFRGGYDFGLSESHLAILQSIGSAGNLEIVNVDAHHDLFYGVPCCELDVNAKNSVSETNCGSWAGHLIHQGRVKSYTQVYPEWRKKFSEDFTGKQKWAEAHGCDVRFMHSLPTIFGRGKRAWKSVDKVFVCRSGCWAPPEYDEKFTAFCKAIGAKTFLKERSTEVPQMRTENCDGDALSIP